jgi:NodT family efflux transporter outer membrane factor (OMF) lipoprotein
MERSTEHPQVAPPVRWGSTLLAGAGSASVAILALALGGCAVGPKYVKPSSPINSNWTEKADTLITTRTPADSAWWRAFSDTTLDQLVHLAYRQNLTLRIAGLRIMEARAQLGIAVGQQYPQIQVAIGSATAVGISEHAPNAHFLDRNYWDYQVGFDAAWEMDFWKKYGQGVRAQGATYLATVADYDNALVSLTAEVARTYAVIRTFEVLLDLARENERVQEEGRGIAESRFRHGATSELDVSQATTLLESTRASIPRLESGLRQSENALSTLLGQPTGAVQDVLGQTRGIPTPPAEVAASVPAEMLRHRPDVRGAEMNAIAQCAVIGVAKADLYPSFSLFGSIGTQASNGSGSLFGPGTLFYQFGPRLLWPLFNYGRIKNNVRVQDARFQQLIVNYQNTVLRAAEEVEDGMTGYIKAQESVKFAQRAAAAAERSVEIAVLQYREGAVDYQRVLDAQRSLLQEQSSLAQTRSAIATNLIALYKALGGGWELRRGQPFVPDSTRLEMERRTNWGNLFSKSPAQRTLNGLTSHGHE